MNDGASDDEPSDRWRDDRRRKARRLERELLGLLPSVLGVAEVTVRRGAEVLRLLEVEGLDCKGRRYGVSAREPDSASAELTNDARAEVEVVTNDLNELLIRLLASAISVDVDRQGLRNTNGVRELHKRTARKATRNERLGC